MCLFFEALFMEPLTARAADHLQWWNRIMWAHNFITIEAQNIWLVSCRCIDIVSWVVQVTKGLIIPDEFRYTIVLNAAWEMERLFARSYTASNIGTLQLAVKTCLKLKVKIRKSIHIYVELNSFLKIITNLEARLISNFTSFSRYPYELLLSSRWGKFALTSWNTKWKNTKKLVNFE